MASWLDIIPSPSGWTLVDTGRMDKLLQSMSHPKTQFPAFLYFAGNDNRIKALQALFPYNNITRRGPAAFSRLHISTETANSPHPILFAESRIGTSNDSGSSASYWQLNSSVERYPFSSTCSKANVRHQMLSEMILP